MNRVDCCVYIAFTSETAFAFAHALPFASNKTRGWFVKQVGKKRREYAYQEPAVEKDVIEESPLLLPSPQPTQPELFKSISIWKHSPPTKRRL